MKKRWLVTLGALAMVLGSGAARADSLVLGGGYNTIYTNKGTVGGGIFGQPPNSSTLNGAVLPWIYCVDFYDHVSVPGSYSNASVTTDGTIAGSTLNNTNGGLTGFSVPGALASVNKVVDVAWLLHNYATAAVGNVDNQIGLQGAIWNTIYSGGITLNPANTPGNSAAAVAAYNANLAALSTAKGSGSLANYVGNYKWISPAGTGNVPVLQGLVTVPDGGVTLMLLGGALVGLETLRRRFRA